MQHSIYKFPSKTNVLEKRKVMLRLKEIILMKFLELKMIVLILADANDITKLAH